MNLGSFGCTQGNELTEPPVGDCVITDNLSDNALGVEGAMELGRRLVSLLEMQRLHIESAFGVARRSWHVVFTSREMSTLWTPQTTTWARRV